MVERRPLKGFEGYYEIDTDGSVFSVLRSCYNRLGRLYTYKPKLIKPISHCTGYQTISLHKEGVGKTRRLHRVIAENLIPNPLNKEYVNHKDGNRSNNRPDNLEWVTAQENTDHAIALGLFKPDGFNNAFCRFTEEEAEHMERLLQYGVMKRDIAEAFCCGRGTVTATIRRLRQQRDVLV